MPAITKSGNVLTKKPTKIEETNSVSFEYVINETTLLNKLKTVDGKGSGLDADLVRGDYVNPRMFKNRIINGDFSVWQRGESTSYASDATNLTQYGGYLTADRIWAYNFNAGGEFTVSKGILNDRSSYKVIVNTPPENLSYDGSNNRGWDPFTYHFEGSHLYDIAMRKSNITISFLWRSNVSGKISISLHNQTSIPDTSKYEDYVTSFESNGNDEIQKIIVTIPLNHNWIQPLKNDNGRGFVLNIGLIGDHSACDPGQENQWTGKNSNNVNPYCVSDYTNWAAQAGNYIEIAELQLEEGEVATEFEHVPYDIQLMRCMRYYEKDTRTCFLYPRQTQADAPYRATVVTFQVPKRTKPSIKFGHIYYSPPTTDITDTVHIWMNDSDYSEKAFQIGVDDLPSDANNLTCFMLGWEASAEL